ncbi:MAG: helix-turn-helix transcriptional regulator [Treponema sp.]|nr:helix-turn-helix transcriptional regulator [Treponema sp.]
MNNQIIVPNVYNSSPDEFFDGSAYLPKEIGDLKLLRKECRNQIVYYDWNLSFKDKTFASRPDNFGKDEIQIIFNINQKIDWQVDSAHESVNMLPGEVCIFRNKNYATSMNYEGDKNFQFKSLQMTTDFFETLLSRYFDSDKIEMGKSLFLTHVTKTAITADMYKVLSEIDGAEKYQEFKGVYVEAKLIELIALVLHGIFYNKTAMIEREKRKLEGNQTDLAQLEALRRRIQFNPADQYKISELAKNLSMSESKLARLFFSAYGTSIHRYIQDQRLEKAAALIAGKSMNVSEAALHCGYSNMSWFSKAFKEKFGVSPKKFSQVR